MENRQLKLNIFSAIFSVVLKPLIKAAKDQFKEHALECVVQIITDLFDKDEEDTKLVPDCGAGNHWDGSKCIPNDPLPPDPTHP